MRGTLNSFNAGQWKESAAGVMATGAAVSRDLFPSTDGEMPDTVKTGLRVWWNAECASRGEKGKQM